jgi:hypothetical protein
LVFPERESITVRQVPSHSSTLPLKDDVIILKMFAHWYHINETSNVCLIVGGGGGVLPDLQGDDF